MENTHRLAPIVDASTYFRLVRDVLLRARHSVLFIGWEFDTRIKLDPSTPLPGFPDTLGAFLSALIDRRPGLRVRLLQWNLGLVGTLVRGTTPLYLLNWISRKRFDFRLDSVHPPGAAHHQKIVVIDDALAFCGGIDMTDDRWDTRSHMDDDPHRVRPSGRSYGAFHDVTMAVDGAAAKALAELARERWRRATGEKVEPAPSADPDLWPANLTPLLRDVNIGIARTQPPYRGEPGIREIERLYLAAIAAARRSIYIEGQYFAARCIGEAIAERLREADGPEIVVVNSKRARGWVEEKAMGAARRRLLGYLRSADHHDRFRIYSPVTPAGGPIYVHAKVLVVDDRILRIGSANLNNRSMGFDTECDLAIDALGNEAMAGTISPAVVAFRNELLAEHLRVDPEQVAAALLREKGSLVRSIEALRSGSGYKLVPLDIPDANPAPLSESEILDPEQPERPAAMFVHSIQDRLVRRQR